MARVLPILAHDREAIRMSYERMDDYDFKLKGLKEVFAVLERLFSTNNSDDCSPLLTFQFSESVLQKEYRKNNTLMVAEYDHAPDTNYKGYFTTLFNNAPPETDLLKDEASGNGLLTVFIQQIMADYEPLIRSSADRTFLSGFEENILRVASDFFWATFIPSYLTYDGNLSDDEKARLETDVTKMLDDKIVNIPEHIVPHIMNLMEYKIKGTFHLNRLGEEEKEQEPLISIEQENRTKRKRIVTKLSEGHGVLKKRKFFFSRLAKALPGISKHEVEQQTQILTAHAVVYRPTNKSVELKRNLGMEAIEYPKEHCGFMNEEVVTIVNSSTHLTD